MHVDGSRWLPALSSAAILASASLAASPAFAYFNTISDGSYVSMSYNDGPGLTGSYATNGGILSYTNQLQSASGPGFLSDITDGTTIVGSYASLASGTLNLNMTPAAVSTAAAAEIWDSFTFSNVPAIGSIGPNLTVTSGTTLVLDLNLTVTTTAPSTDTTSEIQTAIGIQLYNTSGFLQQIQTGADCGLSTTACLGLLASSTDGGTVAFYNGQASNSHGAHAGTYQETFTVPVDVTEALNGVSFLAEIAATDEAGQSFTIDPSISLTNVYPGIGLDGASGINYTAPVPVPAAVWLLGSGLLGLFGVSRRSRDQRAYGCAG